MENHLHFDTCWCHAHGMINGVNLDHNDFGDQYDHEPSEAPEYGCGDMQFDPKPSTTEVLSKYHITQEEYNQICSELKEGLAFGYCIWCE